MANDGNFIGNGMWLDGPRCNWQNAHSLAKKMVIDSLFIVCYALMVEGLKGVVTGPPRLSA
jgi:hypothetical protein